MLHLDLSCDLKRRKGDEEKQKEVRWRVISEGGLEKGGDPQ